MFGNTKLFAEAGEPVISESVTFSDFNDLLAVQLARMVVIPALANEDSFRNRVFGVIGMIPKPKMAWVHTCLVVPTGAIMKHALVGRNGSVMDDPRKNVAPERPSVSSGNLAISVSCNGSSPKPTRIGFVNLFPKPFNNGWGKTLLSEVLRRYCDQRHSIHSSSVRLTGAAELFNFRGFTTKLQSWFHRAWLGRSVVAARPFLLI